MRETRSTSGGKVGIGEQCHGDGRFRRQMRLHQSWYRHEVLGVPYGAGPKKSDETYYGNMLTGNSAEAGLNFLTPEIHGLAKKRIAERSGAVEPFRLLRNMLSSQPMCFNLLGQVALDLELGTLLVRALWGTHIERVTAVRFEWAPAPRGEFLNDRTAFDALIEYESHTGPGFVGVETKLAEPFSPGEYDRDEYRRWMPPDGPWRPDAHPACSKRRYNQLWRDHLLAWALLSHSASEYVQGCLTVVHHPEDSQCHSTIGGYRELLQGEGTFQSFDLGQLVSAWRSYLPEWADKFEERYLALGKSEGAA